MAFLVVFLVGLVVAFCCWFVVVGSPRYALRSRFSNAAGERTDVGYKCLALNVVGWVLAVCGSLAAGIGAVVGAWEAGVS